MTATLASSTADRQRALLDYLLDNTDLQEQALTSGDLQRLNILSAQRAEAARNAAAYVPPAVAWEPELLDLAVRARDRSEQLQFLIRRCMADVRQDLIALTERQRLTNYLPDLPRPRARWSV